MHFSLTVLIDNDGNWQLVSNLSFVTFFGDHLLNSKCLSFFLTLLMTLRTLGGVNDIPLVDF